VQCRSCLQKHPEPLWRDENGEVVEEHKAYGLASHYELIHPDWLLFVDECGSNTSQTKDGQVGGQRFLCSDDRRPQQHAATKDAHFTVLGFTAASGEAVMCAVIFAAKSFRHEWRTGFDPFAEWVGEEEATSSNDDQSQSELIMFNDNSSSKSNEQGDDVMMRTEV
jgi:hypothetical protein